MLAARLSGARLVLYVQAPRHRRVRRAARLMRALVLGVTGAAWFTPALGDPDRHPTPYRAPRYVPFTMEPQAALDGRPPPEGEPVRLLHVGKFQPRKNHRMFLEAVAGLSRRYDIRATVVGECSTPAHRAELEAVTLLRARAASKTSSKSRPTCRTSR